MALSTPSVLNTVNWTTTPAGNAVTSGSVSPGATRLLMVGITGRRSGVVPSYSISDTFAGTQTWTQYAQTGGSTPQLNTSIFVAQGGAAPGAGTVTITSSNTFADGKLQIVSTTGYNQTTPVRNANQATTDIATSLGCTLSGALISTNMGYGVIGDAQNAAPASMAASGFTQLYAANNGSVAISMAVFYDLTSPATTMTVTGLDGTAAGMVYLEVAAALAPTVTDSAATAITTSQATGNGNVTSDGGSPITERGFVLSTSVNPTTADTKYVGSGTTGAYTTPAMTGLSSGTTYHYRAYAINAIGTSYGTDQVFITAVAPTGISPTSTLGSPAVTSNRQNISVTGLASTATIGTPTLVKGAVTISPTGRASTATIGSPTLLRGAVTISPSSRTSTASVGSPTLTSLIRITPVGINNTSSFGTPTVYNRLQFITATGIAKTSALGTPALTDVAYIVATGRASTATLGTPSLTASGVTIHPSSIGSTASVGAPTLLSVIVITPVGISSTAVLGVPLVRNKLQIISVAGIPSTITIGIPHLNSLYILHPTGRASTTTYGTPVVTALAPTGHLKVFVGGSFQVKPVKVYSGSSWEEKPLKYYDGAWL